MTNVTIGEVIAVVTVFAAGISWLIRLEMRNKRCEEKIQGLEDALKTGDNRMNSIDDRIVSALAMMNTKIDQVNASVNDKFNETSKAVAKLEGIILHRTQDANL